MSKIFIEKLILKGKHGVSERERATEQEFHVDISAEVDTELSAKTDDISDTVNYKDFAEIAKRVIYGRSHHLIETLAQRIADGILADKRVEKVSVTIRKTKVLPNGVPGVTIIRAR